MDAKRKAARGARIGTDRAGREGKNEDALAVLRFQYVPPASLARLDVGCELGLERLLYIQALITEDCDAA